MSTIGGYINHGVVLSSASYTNPVLVTGTIVYSGNALVGASPTAWTITNQGTIHSTGDSGVRLQAGGYVDNSLGGLIEGQRYGVSGATNLANSGTIIGTTGYGVQYGSGTLTNAAGALIEGGGGISSAATSIGNAGTIEETSGRFTGVHVNGTAGGTLTNTGVIQAAGNAVYFDRAGTVSNSGVIYSSGFAGVILHAGGSLYNGGGGSIVGVGFGVLLNAAKLTNLGTIEAQRDGVQGATNLTNNGTIISTGGYGVQYATGTLTNAAGALIEGSSGINTSATSIGNAGTIEDTSGRFSSVHVYGTAGILTNSGVIQAVGNAVYFHNAGTVANTGVIYSSAGGGGIGVFVGAGGNLYNSVAGSIVGASFGVEIRGAAAVTNLGAIGGAVGVQFGTGNSTLRNAGAITGYNGTAVLFSGTDNLLQLQQGGALYGAIGGLQISDAIDLAGVRATADYFNSKTGALYALYNGSVVDSFSLTASQSGFVTGNFVVVPDGGGGSVIEVVRYLTGTYTSTVVVTANTATALAATAVVSVTQGNAIVNQAGSAAVLANFGTISATGYGGTAVYLNAGGTVSNAPTYGVGGVIYGYAAGVALSGGGTVVNAGLIQANIDTGTGVVLGGSAGTAAASRAAAGTASYAQTLTNYGTITGYTAIVAFGNYASLTNAGTVVGYGGTAVALAGGDDRLTLEPGAAFTGIADGGGGSSVLALAGLPSAAPNVGAQYIGTLAGIGSSFVNFGTLVVEAGAQWEISGDAASYRFTNDGTIIVSNGIYPSGDTLAFGSLSEDKGDSGVIDLGNYGTAQFLGAVDKEQTLVFTDATGVLQLGDAGGFAARISGFEAGDTIDLIDTAATAYRYSKGKLTLTDDGSKVAELEVSGHYTKHDFQLSSDGSGGTEITFAAGAEARLAAASAYYGLRPPPFSQPKA